MRDRYIFLFLFGIVSACGSSPNGTGDGGPTSAELTYHRDVEPIMEGRCTECHTAGAIGPMPLTTYAEVKDWTSRIGPMITAHLMPPWQASNDCADYIGNRSLTDEQIRVINRWIENGAPEGDPNAPAAPLPRVTRKMSRIDLSLPMPAAYAPAQSPDEYRCFPIRWPEKTRKYVTGFRATPGNAAIVHHVIGFLAWPQQAAAYDKLDADEPGPGYTCFGDAGGPAQAWVGAWAPGSEGADAPEGTGIPIEPGSMIILQIHYNTLAGGGTDLTSIEVKLDDTVTKAAAIVPFADPRWPGTKAMHIPAGQKDVTFTYSASAATYVGLDPVTVYSGALHMHTRGTKGRLGVERLDGSSECVLAIDRWDFHWQGSYELVKPKTLTRGDKLNLECHFDNTAENQPVVNGQRLAPQDVYWGEKTTDEMCLGLFYVTGP